jgi:hypothetical protein
MPYTNRTPEFQELVNERTNAIPQSKRRKADKSALRARHADETRDPLAVEFVREAHHIVSYRPCSQDAIDVYRLVEYHWYPQYYAITCSETLLERRCSCSRLLTHDCTYTRLIIR